MNIISIILPCHNEADNIPEIYKHLKDVCHSRGLDYEIIFVDDGSTDGSATVMEKLHAQDRKVKIVQLSRNFGHQAALCCGLDHARGDAVIMMDADLQHPPELLGTLIDKWKEGYEIVSTRRNDLNDLPLLKKCTARMFYSVINKLGDVKVPPGSADFRLIDKSVARELVQLNEKAKFYRGLVQWVGFKQTVIDYVAGPRQKGTTKFSLYRMFKFALDGIVSFSAFPLQISFFVGVVISLLSFLYTGYAVYIRLFTDTAVQGWTSVLASILFLGGIQLLSLGIIGEYINRIYIELKDRPVYIVRKTVGDLKRKED